MKTILFFTLTALLLSCGKSSKRSSSGTPEINAPGLNTELAEKFTYPTHKQLSYEGQIVADLDSASDVVTPFGVFRKGRTLNVLEFSGKEVLVYGEDGVFATECETHADFPEYGPSHPLCEVAHAESFDRIILCMSSKSSTPIMTAQNWPGVNEAVSNADLGMECWVNGSKMLSKKIFTY